MKLNNHQQKWVGSIDAILSITLSRSRYSRGLGKVSAKTLHVAFATSPTKRTLPLRTHNRNKLLWLNIIFLLDFGFIKIRFINTSGVRPFIPNSRGVCDSVVPFHLLMDVLLPQLTWDQNQTLKRLWEWRHLAPLRTEKNFFQSQISRVTLTTFIPKGYSEITLCWQQVLVFRADVHINHKSW